MAHRQLKLAPSILSADFSRLGDQIREVEQAGADRLHIDVMDGIFVPNLTFGAPVVASIRSVTRLSLEIHMMVSAPDVLLDGLFSAGADSFLIHWEGNNNLARTIQRVKAAGKKAGVVINPATPANVLEAMLPEIDQVLVMTVNPGFGSQKFMPMTLPKIRLVRQMIDDVNPACDLEVDGGIDATTAPLVAEAGANVLVAGTAVYGAKEGVATAMSHLATACVQAS